MSKRIGMSMQTRKNWLIDAAVFTSGIVAALSGIYFLFLPSGGYQGGRNPAYGATVLFSRHTWDDLHTWGGILMIAAAAIHLIIHWTWVKMMARSMMKALRSGGSRLSRGSRFNLALNVLVAISFLLTALSGIYFLFAPSGGFQGGRNAGWDPNWLFSRTTWDLIHTWAGVTFIGTAVIHFWIHWRWVKNVTKRFFASLLSQPAPSEATAEART
jgi:cytochrome b subunit of formate dehydrogenase